MPQASGATRARRTAPALVAALVLPALVYHSILQNYFHADDFLYLQELVNVPFMRFVLLPAAGHLQIVRNAIFVLCYRTFGTDPFWYLVLALATHLLNVALLFVATRRLAGRSDVACLAAALWGSAPARESTLGWYNQYGQVMAATCFLIVLAGVARRVEKATAPGAGAAIAWMLLLMIGALSFGVAVGITLAFPAAVVLLFPGRESRVARRLVAVGLPVVMVGTYWGVHKLFAVLYGFPADESVVTFIRLLADWRQPLVMLAHLLAVGAATVVGSIAYPPSRYPDATGYALAAAFAIALAIDLATADPARRRVQLALLACAVGGYAVIAAGRGVLYGALADVPVHGANAARYHYIAPIPLVIMGGLMLARAADALRVGVRAGAALAAAGLALAGVVWATSGWQIDHFDDDRRATQELVGALGDALERSQPWTLLTFWNQRFGPEDIPVIFAGWASVYTIFFPPIDDARVRFLEPNERIRALGLPGSRLARVLIASPADALSPRALVPRPPGGGS